MALSGAPEMPEVFQGERLQLNGWQLLIRYDTGAEETLPVTENMLTYSTDTAGETTAVLRWNGEELHFPILVKDASLTKIELSRLPDKTRYQVGKEAFDPSGGKVKLYYDTGKTTVIDLTADMVSGFSNAVAGTITLTVTYGGKKTSFTVEIYSAPAGLLGDINGNGKIDSVDYLLLKRYVLGTYKFTDRQKAVADINGKGGINSVDYMLLKRCVLGTYKIS